MISKAANPERVYILGAGSMGGIVAHEISKLKSPKIEPVLLFRDSRRLNTFMMGGRELRVIRNEAGNVRSESSRLLGGCAPLNISGKRVSFIENLVIATKAHQTEMAIKPYIPLLNSKSNVIILQNGMGILDVLKDRFWTSKESHPSVFQAISTHGAYKTSPKVIQHVARGKLSLSHIPTNNGSWKKEKELPGAVRALLAANALNASYVAYPQFLLVQLEKLIVNSCINPLTVIFNCLNGELLYGSKTVMIMKRVIKEAIDAVFAEYEILNEIPTAKAFLNEERLLNSVIDVCKLTAENSSSMREDIFSLQRTEINWINGHISQLGIKNYVSTPVNNMLVAMVQNTLDINKALEKKSTKFSIDP